MRGVLCVGDGVSSFFANLQLGLGVNLSKDAASIVLGETSCPPPPKIIEIPCFQ